MSPVAPMLLLVVTKVTRTKAAPQQMTSATPTHALNASPTTSLPLVVALHPPHVLLSSPVVKRTKGSSLHAPPTIAMDASAPAAALPLHCKFLLSC